MILLRKEIIMSKIKIGWAEVDITPKKGQKIGLAGQFFERNTDEVESPISVTAFAVESGNENMIICSCDLEAIGDNLNLLTKEKLKSHSEINPDKVIFNAIHTHTSYVYTKKSLISNSTFNYLKTKVPEDMKYVPLVEECDRMNPDDALKFLAEKMAEAVILAWGNIC